VHQTAVRAVRLGYRVRKLLEAAFIDIYAGGKFPSGPRARQHEHAHGDLQKPQRKIQFLKIGNVGSVSDSKGKILNPATVCSKTGH
jgi:hypothetical protein